MERVHYATAMKSLHIRDVPEITIERLKYRAVRHHRSLQGELQFLLEDAAKQAVDDDTAEFSLHTVKTSGSQDWSREGIYED
jgi:plasmid stability protein